MTMTASTTRTSTTPTGQARTDGAPADEGARHRPPPAPTAPSAARGADPVGIAAVAGPVEDRLARLLADERARWGTVDAELVEPLVALERAVLGGGKRLRPVFCHWGWVCAGGDPGGSGHEPVEALGAALELLHAFALVHDDVMDDADTRRGLTTTHVDFAGRHAHHGWGGESRRFGDSVAILVGDLAHVLADAVVAELPPATRSLWRELQVELVLGQYLDVLRSAHGEADARQARLIARLKSGRYTIEQPLRLGASLLAGDHLAPDLERDLLAYGAPLGMAFQLRDDGLGAFGVPERTGKPVGDDLREGKPTPLLALARERADAGQRRTLGRVGAPDLGDDEVADLQAVLVDTGALAEIEAEIADLVDAAVTAVHRARIPDDATVALEALAELVACRER